MNILIAMNSHISHTRGGLERTTLNLQQFINSQEGYNAYGLYNDFDKSLESEKFIKGLIGDPIKLRKIIIDKKINIIIFPAGPWYTDIGHKAIQGLKCKIITAYHSKEGYEDYVYYNNLFSLFRNTSNIKDKSINIVKILLSPFLKSRNKKKFRTLMQKGYNKSDAFVLLSDRFKDGFMNYYGLPDKNKLIGIGNALSFNKPKENIDLKIKNKKILIVSRLQEAQKRISLAIKAWARLEQKYPDWSLDIVGDGMDRSYYQSLITRYNLRNVKLRGRQNPIKYYEESSIFLMTSGIEGWGMTLTEAQQYGCVPIAIDSYESLHDILDDSNSIILPNNKKIIDNLENAISRLITDKKLRNDYAYKGIRDCERFTQQTIGSKWLELFNNLSDDTKNT